MSLVMAAMSSFCLSRLQSCSMSAVLPEPTGPPTPMRRGCLGAVMENPFDSILAFRDAARRCSGVAARMAPRIAAGKGVLGSGIMLCRLQTGANLEPMPVNLSIKNAPDDIVRRLRQRAERHHRSLQGELLAIIEEAVRPERSLSPGELLAEVRRLGVRTPPESAAIIRTDRDRR